MEPLYKAFIFTWDIDVSELYKRYKSSWNNDDSGIDIFTAEDLTFENNDPHTKMMKTKVVIKVNQYISMNELNDDLTGDGGKSVPFYLLPRSSIWKTGFRMSNSMGLIDRGYRGELGAPTDYSPMLGKKTDIPRNHISTGERYYQILPQMGSFQDFVVIEVDTYASLQEQFSSTETSNARKDSGFGSTGT